MPIVWKKLLTGYIRIFALSTVGFIAVLIVMRIHGIAKYAALGGSPLNIVKFALFQIPYILPLAIPIACLIAALLLFQSLSDTRELTAMRASGMPLRTITFPVLLAGALLSWGNFVIASEMTPRCRAYTEAMMTQIASTNPLFLLQKDRPFKLKMLFTDVERLDAGKSAENAIFVLSPGNRAPLTILSARLLELQGETLHGEDIAFITAQGEGNLLIENQKEMRTQSSIVTQLIDRSSKQANSDNLPLHRLRAKHSLTHYFSHSQHRKMTIEMIRRCSLALAAFSFTFMGVAFGTQSGRIAQKRGLLIAIGLATLYLAAYICAKSMHKDVGLVFAIYMAPHILIITASVKALSKVARGRA